MIYNLCVLISSKSGIVKNITLSEYTPQSMSNAAFKLKGDNVNWIVYHYPIASIKRSIKPFKRLVDFHPKDKNQLDWLVGEIQKEISLLSS